MNLKTKEYNFEDFKYLAKLSQKSKQYQLGFYFCEQIIIQENQINEDLSELIDQCLKNVLNPLRNSLLTLDLIKSQELQEFQLDIIQEVQFDVYMDLTKKLNLKNQIENKLEQISSLKDDFTILYLYKLHSDLLRYSIEYTHGQIQQKLIKDCEKAYEIAWNFSLDKFVPIFHLRLGLILNRAIFIKKHLNDPQKAIRSLQNCVKESEKYQDITDIDLDEKQKKIMNLIILNLKEWDEQNIKELVKNYNKIIKQVLEFFIKEKINQNLKFLLKREFELI